MMRLMVYLREGQYRGTYSYAEKCKGLNGGHNGNAPDITDNSNRNPDFSAEADVRLPLGDSVIDGLVFQHSPVTAYEAEVAIEHIENRIIPARAALPAGDLILHCRIRG